MKSRYPIARRWLLFWTLFIGLRSFCCRMGRCKEIAAKTAAKK